MGTTVRSTTGTSPIRFDIIGPNQVLIILEDESQQIYYLSEILDALRVAGPDL
jgi:hypothetical protein